MKIEHEIHRSDPPPPPPPPTIEMRFTFSVEEARRFQEMMEHHEQHALMYNGDSAMKKMARDISDKVWTAINDAGYLIRR